MFFFILFNYVNMFCTIGWKTKKSQIHMHDKKAVAAIFSASDQWKDLLVRTAEACVSQDVGGQTSKNGTNVHLWLWPRWLQMVMHEAPS